MEFVLLNIVKEQGIVEIIMNHERMLNHLERTARLRDEICNIRYTIESIFDYNGDRIESCRWVNGRRTKYFYNKPFENVYGDKLFVVCISGGGIKKQRYIRLLETYLNITIFSSKSGDYHPSSLIKSRILMNRNFFYNNMQ